MKLRILFGCTVMCSLAFAASQAKSSPAPTAAAPQIPHLRKQGTATQLIVDGKPFLALAGELLNNSATGIEHMKPIWPKLVESKFNTVLAGVSWAQIEPQEGKFDFTVLDGVIRDARSHNLRLVLLWFGSWKNSLSSYPPDWLKKDFERFPRAQFADGAEHRTAQPLERCQPGRRCPRLRGPDAARQGGGRPRAHGHHDPGGERSGNASRLPRPLARGQQGLRGAGAEGADGLPAAAQGYADSGVSQGVGGGRLQNLRNLGRGVRQGRRDGWISSWPGTWRATSGAWPRRAKPNTRCRCSATPRCMALEGAPNRRAAAARGIS